MARREITCIHKTGHHDPHKRIKSVGGTLDGQRWEFSEDDAIRRIEGGIDTFFTHGGGRKADVIVATHAGKKYLKTENDGIEPNNLLALPEC